MHPNTVKVLALMELERSCDAVAKQTGLAIQDVWGRVKRHRPDLLGARYVKRSARGPATPEQERRRAADRARYRARQARGEALESRC